MVAYFARADAFTYFRFFTEVYMKQNVYKVLSSDVFQFPYIYIAKPEHKLVDRRKRGT